jgi:hypothetical protein
MARSKHKSLTPTSLLPDIDIEHCPNCGGALKIIAAIEDPPAIVRILIHLGLPSRARRARRRSDSIYSKRLKSRNRLPTQAIAAARSEFERAVRSETLRAPPTAAPSKPAKATPGFSSNRKGIDSPVRRYCSEQKKGGLNFLYIGRSISIGYLRRCSMKKLLLTTLVLFLGCSFWDTAAAAADGYLAARSRDEVVANAKKEGKLRVISSLDRTNL